MTMLNNVLDYIYLAIGFGVVIFVHELGHFLAAKYCDVKVEQFAVGFGQAVFSYRKGLGVRWGSSNTEMADLQNAGQAGGVGETEYRLNWIPLGGYVKMLGQDDMRPGAVADDPRAYNNKSIRARMLIVSAGVFMNIILAAVGFMIVFLAGYPVPPARVGGVISMSPAVQTVNSDGERVPLQSGDEILSIDGRSTIGDFTKIQLGVALAQDGETMPIEVKHLDGKTETLYAKPVHPRDDARGLLVLGVMPPSELAGFDPKTTDDWDVAKIQRTMMPDTLAVSPGDVITKINGQDVKRDEFWKLDQAAENSDGKPIVLTVLTADGKTVDRPVSTHFLVPLGKLAVEFAGLEPRARVSLIQEDSPIIDKLKPGDVIVALEGGRDKLTNPGPDELAPALDTAGKNKIAVTLTVLSPGDTQTHTIKNIVPSIRLPGKKMGLGIGIGYDEQHLVVAQTEQDSPAFGKIPAGSTILSINGRTLSNWFEVRRVVCNSKAGDELSIMYLPPGDEAKPAEATIKLTSDSIDSAQMIAMTTDVQLRPMPGTLRTSNPFKAIVLGTIRTRDSVEELYLTLLRMFQGDVSVTNVMGPVGIFHAGAQLAGKGMSWLIWFLANISANLAVVNFLPIPIVDGGLFTLLILEKIQGKPLSMETQRLVQMVGLALILGVFLLVTYQDIVRMTGYAN